MILELLQNIALLVTLSVVLQVLVQQFERPGRMYQLAAGALFGIVSIVTMTTTLQLAPGLLYDGRTIILSLAGFVGGPLTGLVAAVISLGYRLILGGPGVVVGMLVIVQSTAFGIIFYYLRQRNPRWEKPLYLWVLGVIVNVPTLALQLLLPDNLWLQVLPVIAPSVLVVFPLVFMVTALVFLGNEHRRTLGIILAIQNRMLEMIAASAPLVPTLHALVNEIEAQLPSLKASILLLDQDGRHLRHVAAPSLPAAYVAATDGVEVGDGVGSCGTAIWRRCQIIVENIGADPLWAGYRDLALQHGLRASWSTPIYDDAGNVFGTFAMYYEKPMRPTPFHLQLIEQATHLASIAITRHRQEQVLRAERDFARQVMDAMSEGLVVSDINRRLTYVNKTFADMVGRTIEEMLGSDPTDFVVTDDPTRLDGVIEMRRQGIRSSYELRLRHTNGTILPVLVSGAPHTRDGQFQGTIAVLTDLTERIRSEVALRESEERYRRLVDTSPLAIVIIQDGKIVFANRAAAQMLGVVDESMLAAKPIAEIVEADRQAEVSGFISRMLEGESSLYHAEYTFVRVDGVRVPAEISAAPFLLEGQVAIQVIAQDITERKRRQRQLEAQAKISQALSQTVELEPLLDHILEAATHAIKTANKGSIMLPDADEVLQIRALRGYKDPRSLTVRFPHNFGYGARCVRERRPLLITDVRSDAEIAYVGEIEEVASVQSAIVAPLAVGGRIIGVITLDNTERRTAFDEDDLRVLTDIATTAALVIERARLFEEVKTQARQMAQIMQTAPQGLLLIDATGQVIMINPMGERDLINLADARPGGVISDFGGQPLTSFLQASSEGPWHEVQANGHIYEIIARPVPGETEPVQWVILIDDVTRSRQVREQVEQQERLAVVGQLAAGIAHDFNNILNVILLHAQLAVKSAELSDGLKRRMDMIVSESHNASNLIRQILDFSRQSLLQRNPINLVDLLTDQVRLLEHTFPETIKVELVVEKSLAGDTCIVSGDLTRLRQVIMNLALNARDAMPAGGKLCFEVGHVTLQAGQPAHLPTTPAGEWVRLTVTDTGTGIPAEVLPHIFDPFFTTKSPDKGTGLGLAQVHGIIAQHDGYMSVESESGRGTSFVIDLPAMHSEGAIVTAPGASDTLQVDHHQVLLVEDNQALRLAMTDMLEAIGYDVVAASNGQAALVQMAERGAGFALVLSDVVMPEMGGIALAQALRERGWQTPIILMSGHPLDGEMDSLKGVDISGVLPKPCSMDVLAQMMAEAIRRSQFVAAHVFG